MPAWAARRSSSQRDTMRACRVAYPPQHRTLASLTVSCRQTNERTSGKKIVHLPIIHTSKLQALAATARGAQNTHSHSVPHNAPAIRTRAQDEPNQRAPRAVCSPPHVRHHPRSPMRFIFLSLLCSRACYSNVIMAARALMPERRRIVRVRSLPGPGNPRSLRVTSNESPPRSGSSRLP